ncbi:MAG TPA: hypothetical protein VJX67_27030 [Blastocatellia bacterium]|nr:hypothetical protein [Blastocatellia bacterium]
MGPDIQSSTSFPTSSLPNVPAPKEDGWFPACTAFLWGVGLAFAACCLAGYVASRYNPFYNFHRFHVKMAPESLFYPTASQFRDIVLSTADASKIIVIVGGSSNFHGVSQPVDQLWTRRLQVLLGDDYAVYNFALRGGMPTEAGGVAAETLFKVGRKVIYVADFAPGLAPPPDGQIYRYLFWDAYYKGYLLHDKGREAWLREIESIKDSKYSELRLGERLDSALYFNDLWNTVAYRRVMTVWNFLVAGSFSRPRRAYPDAEADGGSVPVAQRYAVHDNAAEMKIVRSRFEFLFRADNRGRLQADFRSPTWRSFSRAIRQGVPPIMREHSLMVVLPESPYYLQRLTPDEQDAYAQTSRLTVRELQAAGFHAATPLGIFDPADYNDRTHMVARGGQRLAAFVGRIVRAMAVQLGYGVEEQRK